MFSVFAGELIYLYIGMWAVVSVFLALLSVFGFCYVKGKIWAWYIIIPLLFLAGALRIEQAAKNVPVLSGDYYELTGRAAKITEKENYVQIQLYKDSVGILLYCYDKENVPDMLPGDVISCIAQVSEFDTARNPGNFDSKAYYLSSNIVCRAKAKGKVVIVKPNNNIWIKGIFALKNRLSNVYDRISVGNDAGIYKSIVLGDKSELDADIKKLYRLNGMAHILAISGLHISLIGMSIYKLLRKCCIPFAPASFISTVLIVSYAVMTGGSVSAIRAVVMFLLSIYADLCGRRYDILSAVSFAAAVTFFVFPFAIYNSGFWLSYTAVMGIVLLKPVFDKLFGIKEMKKKLVQEKKKTHGRTNKVIQFKIYLIDGFDTSLSVSLMTMPVILYSYYEIAPYSVILNMIVIPLMTLVMTGAVLGALAGLFCIQVGVFFAGISHYVLMFYEIICRAFMKLPGSVVVLGKPYRWEILLFYALMAFVIVITYVRVSKFALAAVVFGLIFTIRNDEKFVRMIDVGQGDCIHISYAEKGGNINILIDGGSSSISNVGEYRILPYLKSLAITQLDYVIMSHADNDHVSGLLELASSPEIQVKCFVLPDIANKSDKYMEVESTIREKGINIIYMGRGDYICTEGIKNVNSPISEPGLEISCIHPVRNYQYEDENNYSLVLNVNMDGIKFLLTGDIGEDTEKYILSNKSEFTISDVDVLKVAHHGSRYSTCKAFLDMVQPQVSLISAGAGNRYSHPHDETITRLGDAGSDIYVTAQKGAVTVKNIKNKIIVESFLK